MEENVILVDELDNEVGLMPKMEAHKKAVLHRAFSVFIFNDTNKLMLQQRAKEKYHSPLLWTNTCCSHQKKGESNIGAGKRRLQEEMGFSCELEEVFSFIYKVSFNNGLAEHELDYVMAGRYNGEPDINKKEVEGYKWISLEHVKKDIQKHPENYTAWFKIIFEKSYDKIANFRNMR